MIRILRNDCLKCWYSIDDFEISNYKLKYYEDRKWQNSYFSNRKFEWND